MHAKPSRVHAVLALTCLLVLILSIPSLAFAASTYYDQYPAVGASSTEATPRLSVKVSDPAGVSGGYQLKLDGVTKSVKAKWGSGNAYLELYYQVPTSLANGTHTVYASVLTGAGRTSNTWTFKQQVAPTLGPLAPADGSTVDTQTPTISVGVGTNGSALESYSMYVDGVVVSPSYDSATKTLSYRPTSKLSNNRGHSVGVEVTDASGAVSSVGWTFTVRTYAVMVDTQGCTQCHDAYPAAHPMTNCEGCHAGDAPFPAYWNMDDRTPHAADYLLGIDCSSCHSSVFPTVPNHPAEIGEVHESGTDMSGCPCHVGDLTNEHSRYTASDGGAIDCASCHASSDPQVQAGMAIGTRECANCHTIPAEHSYEGVDHVADVGAGVLSGKLCTDCHEMDLRAEHSKETASSANSSCGTCHQDSADPIPAWNQTCAQSGCHAVGSEREAHTGMTDAHAQPSESTCDYVGCHSNDVSTIHAGASKTVNGTLLTSCNVCHDGNLPTKDCSACHGATAHGDMQTLHQSVPGTGTVPAHYGRALQVDCTTCHSLSLIAIHTSDCAMCHASTKPAVKAAIASWNGTCEACHATYHAEAQPAHQALYSFYGNTCNRDCHGDGSTDGSYRKMIEGCLANCHQPLVLGLTEPPTWTVSGGLKIHQRYRTRISGGSWPNYTRPDQRFTVPNGVETIYVDMYGGDGSQGGAPPYEAPGGLGGRVQLELPVAQADDFRIRVGESAVRPHSEWRWSAERAGWPNGGFANGAAPAPYTDGAPGAGQGGGSTLLMKDGQIVAEAGAGGGGGGGAPGSTGGTGGFPGTGAGGGQTGGMGAMTSPYGGGGGGGWNAGAGGLNGKGGGGGTSFARFGTAVFTPGAGRPSGKFDYQVDVAWVDDMAPMTTVNVSDVYVGEANLTFVASDDGGSNVAYTWFTIDKGTPQIGTELTVPSTGSSKTHTLSWYSVDKAGNIEPMKTTWFTVE